MAPSLCAVICANGFGHFNRVTGILSQVVRKQPDLQLSLMITGKQASDSSQSFRDLVEHGATIVTDVTAPGVALSKDPDVYDDGRLITWESRLNHPLFHDADLVWTDNMVGPVGLRDGDGVFGSGNFHWGDNLLANFPGSEAVREFAKHERRILLRHPTTPWLCVGAIAKANLFKRTQAVEVGWMSQSVLPDLPPAVRSNKIAIFGGGTGMADNYLAKAAAILVRSGRWEVSLTPALHQLLDPGTANKTQLIAPNYNRYNEFAAVVARPGAGTLNACVESFTPLVCVNDADHEMDHNGERMQALNLGCHLRDNVDAIDEVLGDMIRGASALGIWEAMQSQNRRGFQQSVDYVASRVESVR